ncbi:MAG TPA: NAD(P)-binding domain-containing protein, partial [Candidatus Nitrosotenuis sp.]|nr:NAD(P)-binding domain-containing protein [Candidatus Nitrosotenuis sp.]
MVSQKQPLREDNNISLTGQWTIIGAGPAGIAAVGKLLDSGIDPAQIIWLDPEFKVGDFGQKWRSVSSNTTVKLFQNFLNSCPSFQYSNCSIDFPLNNLPPNDTCLLETMADPLQWVSDHLCQKVHSIQTMASEITLHDGQWSISLSNKNSNIITKKIILAIGAEPCQLNLPNLITIPINDVVDLKRLRQVCSPNDTIAVFGSSHSAIVALYNLTAIGAKIINFYRSPLKYAVAYDDWILYD